MKEPVMSMYTTKQECLEARADFLEDQRDALLYALRELRKVSSEPFTFEHSVIKSLVISKVDTLLSQFEDNIL